MMRGDEKEEKKERAAPLSLSPCHRVWTYKNLAGLSTLELLLVTHAAAGHTHHRPTPLKCVVVGVGLTPSACFAPLPRPTLAPNPPKTQAYGELAFNYIPRSYLIPQQYWLWRSYLLATASPPDRKWVLKANIHRRVCVICVCLCVLREKKGVGWQV